MNQSGVNSRPTIVITTVSAVVNILLIAVKWGVYTYCYQNIYCRSCNIKIIIILALLKKNRSL